MDSGLARSVDDRGHLEHRLVVSVWGSRVSLASAAIVALTMLVIAARLAGPTVHPDEFGFLINGQVLIGRDEAPIPTGSFYPAGYGLVTGLGHLVTGSMSGAYTFALVVNVLLAVATAWCGFRLVVRGFGGSTLIGYVAGSLVFVLPGTIVSSMYSWAETAARLVFLLFIAVVLRAAQTLSRRDVVGLGLYVGLMPALHGRFTLLIPVVGGLLLWWLFHKRITARVFLTAGTAIVVGYALSYVLNTFVKSSVYTTSYDQENRLLERLLDPTLWPALGRTMVGQSWYLIATTLGLFGVAVAYGVNQVRLAWRENRQSLSPQATAVVVMFVAALAVIFTGGLQLLYGDRGDHLIYGRYVEMVVPAFVIVACVAFERSFRSSLRALFVTALAIPLVAFIYIWVDGEDLVRVGHIRDTIVYPNIVGIDFARYVVTPGLISFALFFFVAAFALYLVLRFRGSVGVVFLVIVFGASSIYSGFRTVVPRTNLLERSGVTVQYVRDNQAEVVGFDKGVRNDRAYYYLRWFLHPIDLEMLDLSSPFAEIPDNVLCAYGWPDRPPSQGQWEIVADETPLGRVLWKRVNTTTC